MRERMEKEKAEEARLQARLEQEEADLEVAGQLQEDIDFDDRRREAQAWEVEQDRNPLSDPLLLPRADIEANVVQSSNEGPGR